MQKIKLSHIDFQSLEDRQVTIRDRDTMAQVRVLIAEVADALKAQAGGGR